MKIRLEIHVLMFIVGLVFQQFIQGKGQDEFLVVSDRAANKLYQIYTASGEARSVFSGALNVTLGVAYDSVENDVYVADQARGIWRHSLSTGAESLIHSEPGLYFADLTMDETYRKLYYTEWLRHRIGSIDVRSLQHVVLLNTTGGAVDVVVDSKQGLMYWTEDSPSTIKRAFLNNLANSMILISTNIGIPHGLAVDSEAGDLYWGDNTLHKIETCKLDGSDRRVVATSVPYINYFSMTSNFIYLTRSGYGCVQKMDRQTFNITDQEPCIFQYGWGIDTGVSAATTLTYETTTEVTTETRLTTQITTATTIQEEFLIVSDYNAHEVFQVTPLTGDYQSLFNTTLDKPLGVTYDSVNNDVYVADRGTGIWRHSMTTGVENVIYREPGSYIGALALNDADRRLYYTDYYGRRICEIDVSSLQRSVLIGTAGRPHGITVDSSKRLMYWTEDGPPIIKSVSLDNMVNTVTLVNTEIVFPYAIAGDFTSGLLYWGDAELDKIETCNLDGSNRRVVANDPGSHFTGFVLNNDFVYIADYNSRCVRKMHIHTFVISDEPQCVYSALVGIATNRAVRHEPVIPDCGSVLHNAPNDTYLVPGWSIGCYIDKYNDLVAWQQTCRSMLVDLPLYDTADGLLANGGNFGCYATDYITDDVSSACQNNLQHDLIPRYCLSCQMLAVCIRFP